MSKRNREKLETSFSRTFAPANIMKVGVVICFLLTRFPLPHGVNSFFMNLHKTFFDLWSENQIYYIAVERKLEGFFLNIKSFKNNPAQFKMCAHETFRKCVSNTLLITKVIITLFCQKVV